MRFSRCLRSVKLEKSICYLVAASFFIWILLGLYFLSQTHSEHHQNTWKNLRGDEPNPKFRKFPNLQPDDLSEKLKENDRKNVSIVKNENQAKLPLLDQLKQIHNKKLADAGIEVNLGDSIDKKEQMVGNEQKNPLLNKLLKIHENKLQKAGFDVKFNQEKSQGRQMDDLPFPPINYNVHLFYYPWYGSPERDGAYYHWNHRFIPHWNKAESLKWPMGSHKPPDDIGANFYPALGPYSSGDPEVVQAHMAEMRSTGAGVVSVSWYPPRDADTEGTPPDRLMPLILDTAQRFNMKVNLHIEPYKDRNAATLRENLRYIMDTYGQHPAFYRTKHKGRLLPLYYIYDSYNLPAKSWAELFAPNGAMTVRGTDLDGVFIGLLVEKRHRDEILTGGFDGCYTYFASNGFTYGSSWKNWQITSNFAKSKNLLFIPSVGPGYVDTRVRPWNGMNTKHRDHGKYYESAFEAALNAKPPFVSITSYNEWHEGTQIESAVAKMYNGFVYEDYEPNGKYYYLELTRKWVKTYSKKEVMKKEQL